MRAGVGGRLRIPQFRAGLTGDEGAGLFAPDRAQLLEHWASEYPGPGGQEFGWYGLSPTAEQVEQVASIAAQLEVQAVVSGVVAADSVAPWKLPTHWRVYVSGPIDLADDGFVPAPLDEASLVVCFPRDPTLWRLATPTMADASSDDLLLADAAIIYWDLLMSGGQDSEEAAQQVSRILTGEQR